MVDRQQQLHMRHEDRPSDNVLEGAHAQTSHQFPLPPNRILSLLRPLSSPSIHTIRLEIACYDLFSMKSSLLLCLPSPVSLICCEYISESVHSIQIVSVITRVLPSPTARHQCKYKTCTMATLGDTNRVANSHDDLSQILW